MRTDGNHAVRTVWRSLRFRWRRLRATLRPGPSAWRGATLGAVAAVTVGLAVAGTVLVSGRGILVDAVTAIVGGGLLIGVLTVVLLGIGRLVRGIPPRLRVFGVVASVVLGAGLALPASPSAVVVAGAFVLAGSLVGAGMASLRPPAVAGSRRRVAVTGVAIGLLGVAAVAVWLGAAGTEPAAEPVTPDGPYAVSTLTYGSGDHPHREVFGPGVDVVTSTVDGAAFLGTWTGVRGWLRSRYWGFGPDRLPRNATVWLPATEEPAPLVLVVHGNHPMEAPSDEGYAWLAEDLASRGYVVASVDQTFLNLSLTRGLDLGDENDARAWLLLEHLRLWRDWQDDPASPFHGTVDLGRIALIGHSRGGEAVAHAALFDRLERYPEDATVAFDAGFGIDAVVAIAPVDGQYEPAGRRTPLEDVGYLTLHGGRDGDVASFVGLRQYARTTFSGERFTAKSAVYLEDANHGQFNTAWGRRDFPGIAGRTLETAALMAGDAQRRDARAAIVAFLDATLRDDLPGLDLLQDPAHPAWSGATRVLTRYADSTEVVVAGFEEDTDPGTGTLAGTVLDGSGLAVWREERAPLRWGDDDASGVLLAWVADAGADARDGAAASFTVEVPGGVDLEADAVLRLDLADPGEPIDGIVGDGAPATFVVEFVDAAGTAVRTPVSDHGGVPRAPAPRRLKAPLLDPLPAVEALAQTVQIPLPMAPRELRVIRLVFDGPDDGAVRLDRVAVAPAPSG